MLFYQLPNKISYWLTDPGRGFGPPTQTEQIVFGARRPGFPFSRVPLEQVARWLAFMRRQGVTRVVCLLPVRQLRYYSDDLIAQYQLYFGAQHVCWVPIDDFTLVDEYALINRLLPFLFRSVRERRRVVVHCSGGIGRTGHILAAWLVAKYGFSNRQAVDCVRRAGRNAREARDPRLDDLLDRCRQVFVRV